MGPLFLWGVLAMLLITSLVSCGTFTGADEEGQQPPDVEGVVERIVDGDTLYVDALDERVRLIGIDAPETSGPVECFGEEATTHLTELVPPGTSVELRFDVEERDRFDRYLAYLYRQSDGMFVNEQMVLDGFALILTIPPNVAHTEVLEDAQDGARRSGAGLWTGCDS